MSQSWAINEKEQRASMLGQQRVQMKYGHPIRGAESPSVQRTEPGGGAAGFGRAARCGR